MLVPQRVMSGETSPNTLQSVPSGAVSVPSQLAKKLAWNAFSLVSEQKIENSSSSAAQYELSVASTRPAGLSMVKPALRNSSVFASGSQYTSPVAVNVP